MLICVIKSSDFDATPLNLGALYKQQNKHK